MSLLVFIWIHVYFHYYRVSYYLWFYHYLSIYFSFLSFISHFQFIFVPFSYIYFIFWPFSFLIPNSPAAFYYFKSYPYWPSKPRRRRPRPYEVSGELKSLFSLLSCQLQFYGFSWNSSWIWMSSELVKFQWTFSAIRKKHGITIIVVVWHHHNHYRRPSHHRHCHQQDNHHNRQCNRCQSFILPSTYDCASSDAQ